jgi:hypothetical protein
MGNTQLPFHQRPSFINPAQEHVAEVERPDAVVDFVEPDAVLAQGGGEVEEPRLESNGPGVRDPLDDEVSGILQGRHGAGVEARGRPIERAGCATVEELVRALIVVFGAEAVEGALLRPEVGARGPTGA